MRRSRGLAFKREQEQKLGSLLNRDSTSSRVNSSSHVPEIDSSRRTIPAPSAVRPDARSMREALRDIRDVKKPVFKPIRKQVDSDEEEDHQESDKEVLEDRHEESEEERYEDEEEVKPVVQKGRALKPNNHKDEVKLKEQPKQVAAQKTQRGRKPKVQEPEAEEEEERSGRVERVDREDVDEDKKRKMIVSKSFFQKMIATANIDTTSSDIFPTLQQEMIDYIVEVIKIVSNNEDDEVVVKDSNLRFLGEKDKAVGNLDVKLFEKLYSEAQKILVHNVTFTSESFKSLCKYTEIHVLDFLKKARALMAHAGRKRLTLADIELLKFILE